jgi:uncharacterized lipoprotein YddW (UPF0748 family)
LLLNILNKPRTLSILILLGFTILTGVVHPQIKHETRAVWVATNFKIDWPPHSFNEELQKENLKQIFQRIRSLNFNTVYFQIRSNATVIYPSKIEAFSPYFKGRLDDFPSYDPLALAVKTAHNLGLEIHAWVNVFRCFSGSDKSFLNYPKHLTALHKNWIVEYYKEGKKSLWLDPGLPDVQDYLIRLLKELVNNYNIDGINLDYLRYPGKDFDDSFSYSVYGNGKDRGDWRRGNIINFLTRVYTELKKINPFIKIGVAPIGIYKNNGYERNFSGYADVFQDSYAFLKNKIVDYLSPQVYWALKDSPPFGPIAADWIKHSNGRNIVLGLGIYKSKVAKDIPLLIKLSRKLGANGIAFFRYDYLSKVNFKGFEEFAYPAKMEWIKTRGVLPPAEFTAEVVKDIPLKIQFSWQKDTQNKYTEPPAYFSLFVKKGEKENLITMVPAERNSIILTINEPAKKEYSFRLKAVDKLWNESKGGKDIFIVNKYLAEEIKFRTGTNSPLLFEDKNARIIGINSSMKDTLKIAFQSGGKEANSELTFLLFQGKNLISLPKVKNTSRMKLQIVKAGKTYILNLHR